MAIVTLFGILASDGQSMSVGIPENIPEAAVLSCRWTMSCSALGVSIRSARIRFRTKAGVVFFGASPLSLRGPSEVSVFDFGQSTTVGAVHGGQEFAISGAPVVVQSSDEVVVDILSSEVGDTVSGMVVRLEVG